MPPMLREHQKEDPSLVLSSGLPSPAASPQALLEVGAQAQASRGRREEPPP